LMNILSVTMKKHNVFPQKYDGIRSYKAAGIFRHN